MSYIFQDEQMPRMVSVLPAAHVDRAYDYTVPPGMILAAGDIVRIPLGSKEIPGIVIGTATGDGSGKKIKSIISKYDLPVIPPAHRQFITRMAEYTLIPQGAVLKMVLSASDLFKPPKEKKRKTKNEDKPENVPCENPAQRGSTKPLSPDQNAAAQTITALMDQDKFSAALLDGVTGAGKTEVYFEAAAHALENNHQVLILLPEIALTNAFMDRFVARFGCAPALWHSGLSPAQRRKTWRGVADGRSKVVIGARSALMLPFADLGLIIVDEEHDPAYKQEENGIYHARDMAVLRAQCCNIPVVLVSATPSLETMHNAWQGRYNHITLPDRFGGATMPKIEIIDMRREKMTAQQFIASPVKDAIARTLAQGEQALLFLNRRGYAPLTLCRSCGHRMNCPRCSSWMVQHKFSGKLHCHHCGHTAKNPAQCPECKAADSMVSCGPGVERVMEEAQQLFPDARCALLSSDMGDNPETLRAALEDIRDGRVDIIVGTQIIAKGHHFPRLTLVGAIDADLGLDGAELRASERTYQLLHQVAGRSGRADRPGTALLQTYNPLHPIMAALAGGGRDDFLKAELDSRARSKMPPFSRLAGIILSGRKEAQVIAASRDIAQDAPHGQGIETLGPAPAPMAKIRGKYRYRFLVRANRSINLQKAIRGWLGAHKIPSAVRVAVDIDPQSFH